MPSLNTATRATRCFSEKISTRVRVRPQFEAALALTRQIKAHVPHCRVIFTVYEMNRLSRDVAELTALADHLIAHGLVLEMLAGPLPGIYDPAGRAVCSSRSSPGWRRPSGRTSGSRREAEVGQARQRTAVVAGLVRRADRAACTEDRGTADLPAVPRRPWR
ncbi:recombinase family protein [Streptomyces sp. NPDC005538]|uniref:recombinase family protein n=1 Tax=unclassified Streptomyces TaxID=2593676 RepID=UPI0033A32D59